MTVAKQLQILGTAVCLGALGAMIFNFLSTYQEVFRIRKGWRLNVLDFGFWLFFTLFTLAVLFMVNWGEVRFYLFPGLAAGALLYSKTINRLICPLFSLFWKTILRVLVRFKKKISPKRRNISCGLE